MKPDCNPLHMTEHSFLRHLPSTGLVVACLIASASAPATAAQAPAPGRGAPGPSVTSPDVGPDRRVTFRLLAPEAQKVELRSPGDIPGISGRGVAAPQLTKNADGVWET